MKFLYSPASPYSAKVRMAAAYAGLAFESEVVDTNAAPSDLVDHNPLGKIPVLVTDSGEAVYDSAVITQYLNRQTKNVLFPRNAEKWLEAVRLEALADGICDSLLAHVYERRFRPAEKIEQSWLDKQWSKVERGLDSLNATPPRVPTKISAGHIALRAMLGYAALRFDGKWEKGRSRLKRWAAKFDERFPELVPYLPK